MNSITTNQREILLSVEGTNIWSSQGPQTYNSQAIAWGGLAKDIFSAGGTQVMVFILSFAVQGGAGNLDYCMQNPYTAASGGGK
jgi:hypothetical protein